MLDETTTAKSVLIIDDEEGLRSILEGFLLKAGYSTSTAANCKLGLQRIQSGQFYDLIICDIKTPVMNGIEFCTQLRALGHTSKVIILSGNVSKDTILATQKLGISKYLAKPIRPAQLLEVVTEVFATPNSASAADLKA